MSNEYPTDTELSQIREWPVSDSRGWLSFVAETWNTDYGTTEQDGPRNVWRFGTGGWSGNEDILGAMADHNLWLLCWQSSHRGGVHYFEPKEVS